MHALAFRLDASAVEVEALARLLSPDEAARAARFSLAPHRRRFVIGRAGMRRILGHYLRRDAHRLRFQYDAHQKPSLVGTDAEERLRFNLSGSHELAVLAVQWNRDLGIDVERVRSFPKAEAFAERFFSPREQAALRARPPAELDAAFFAVWTRKEALVKCLGRGLSYPLQSFSVALAPPDSEERIDFDGPDGPECRWVRPLSSPGEGYLAALATETPPSTVRYFAWEDPGREPQP